MNTQAADGHHSGLGQDERGRRLRPKLDQACTAYRAGGAVAAAAARTGQARGELSGRAGELLTYLLTYCRRCWCPLPGRVSAAGFPDHLITSREFSVSVEMVVTYFAWKPGLSITCSLCPCSLPLLSARRRSVDRETRETVGAHGRRHALRCQATTLEQGVVSTCGHALSFHTQRSPATASGPAPAHSCT